MSGRSRGRRSWLAPSLLLILLLAGSGGAAEAGERWVGLQAMPRVAVEVTISPNHPDLGTEEVRRRIEEALRRAQPAPALDPAADDRLHLVVGIRTYSTSELRGYYLPLSQAHGIGPVRLLVERPAAIAGLQGPLWATVWQSERQAKGPMRRSADEILELVDEVVNAFLADYRRALGQ